MIELITEDEFFFNQKKILDFISMGEYLFVSLQDQINIYKGEKLVENRKGVFSVFSTGKTVIIASNEDGYLRVVHYFQDFKIEKVRIKIEHDIFDQHIEYIEIYNNQLVINIIRDNPFMPVPESKIIIYKIGKNFEMKFKCNILCPAKYFKKCLDYETSEPVNYFFSKRIFHKYTNVDYFNYPYGVCVKNNCIKINNYSDLSTSEKIFPKEITHVELNDIIVVLAGDKLCLINPETLDYSSYNFPGAITKYTEGNIIHIICNNSIIKSTWKL